jgi:hypothetical protein
MSRGCRYDEAGPWMGGTRCAGHIKRGTFALGKALANYWGGSFGGYACRQNTADASQMSVHGTGRALDFFPQSRGEGDAIAAFLVAHHEQLGIQLVIWWRRDWQCGPGWTVYGGPVPHTDHLHIEQDASAAETIFPSYFLGPAGGNNVFDRAALTYLNNRFEGVRTAQARAAKRQLDAAAKSTARHRQLLVAIQGADADVEEVDRELTILRQRMARLDAFIRAQGADPEAEDDEFGELTDPIIETEGPLEGPDEP